ncbi:MAG: ABC transporter substrate-binding protein [Oscillospiraceae bacterium]|jgi:peptide/nickel transport system substrate-binding protein|nr:ABC transporter substrate-binding protein [Oscillospiraceae bacterium]
MKSATRKLLAILLCIAVASSLFACKPKAKPDAPGTDAQAPVKDTLNISVSQDNGTLNALGITGGFIGVSFCYQEPLLDMDSDMEVVWRLATGWDKVSDTQYTLHLREGVTFSNGNPFTADDVIFSLKLYFDDPGHSFYVDPIDLENTAKIDDHTVDLRYTSYSAASVPKLTMVQMFDEESYDETALSTRPIGTGAYVVTEYIVNNHVTMKARDDYWEGVPKIKTLVFKVLNEASQIVNSLDNGTVDVATVPAEDLDYVKTLTSYNINQTPANLCDALFFNMMPNSVFSSKEARYAVMHAINRDTILNLVYHGLATATALPVSMFSVDLEDRFLNLNETYSVGYDLELAKRYAEAAGLSGQTVVLVTNGAAQYITMAEIIQASLLDIGVTVKVQNYDMASYWTVTEDPTMFDMSLYCTAAPSLMIADVIPTTFLWSDPGWRGADFDRFMELGGEVLSIPDAKERGDVLYEIVQLFVDAAPWYGICDTYGATAYKTDLAGVKATALGYYHYSDWSFT